MNIILDIETTPQDTASLEKLMPPEIASPVMPEEIKNPVEPDFAAKCPKYGGDEEKRAAWIEQAKTKWKISLVAAVEKWRQAALDNRARFVESAALRAESGHVKMIGIAVNGERSVYVWEPDRKVVSILEKEAAKQKLALLSPFMREQQMFQRFAKDLVAMMDPESQPGAKRILNDIPRLITYYGNTFDLPFLARRAAICGEPALMRFLRLHRRGRYLDGSRFVDLHEEWIQADRETRTGGLDGLARMLGIEDVKKGEGGTFYHFYKTDPTEGLAYLLNDLQLTQACAERMGL